MQACCRRAMGILRKVQQACSQTKELRDKAEKRMENLQKIVETQKSEIKKLETTIQEAESEKRNQRKELEGVRGSIRIESLGCKWQ